MLNEDEEIPLNTEEFNPYNSIINVQNQSETIDPAQHNDRKTRNTLGLQRFNTGNISIRTIKAQIGKRLNGAY